MQMSPSYSLSLMLHGTRGDTYIVKSLVQLSAAEADSSQDKSQHLEVA